MRAFSQLSYSDVFGFLSAAGLVCLFIVYLTPLARKIGLVDVPGQRKTHTGSVPLIGGIVIAASLSLSLLLFPNSFKDFRFLFFGIGLLTIVGALDDQKEIHPYSRFCAQILVALALVILDGTVVSHVGNIFGGTTSLGLGILTIPFSIVAIVGAVNAYNMIDGHDGLAGFSFIVSLLAFLLLLFYRATDADLQYIVLVILLIVLMLVFIPFNIGLLGSRRKIFLGDAGSMLCGLVMVFLLIRFAQREVPVVTTTAAAWILGIPLLDMFAVIFRRLLAKTPITQSDRNHIHHFLGDLGLTKGMIVVILVTIHSILVSVGVLGTLLEWPDAWLFWGAFLPLGIYLVIVFYARSRNLIHRL